MTRIAARLAMLRHGDSAFPGGTASFSWGLETLVRDGLVRNATELEAMLHDQLRLRWATGERAALLAAWDADRDLACIARIDHILEARTLAREWREGSRRAGSALLSVHVRLGTEGAADYQRALATGEDIAPGLPALSHLTVMQGLLWRQSGIDRIDAALMAAHTIVLTATGASIRLGIIGHIDAQAIVGRSAKLIADLLAEVPPPLDEIHAFVPLVEIASMRHETGEMRLFSN
ncbi:MAG: urease accessory UreF family protein [Rhodospirillaceae bacterium]|nr:urease accessory UreF family protein [Rhodospirillaceae bacterium]